MENNLVTVIENLRNGVIEANSDAIFRLNLTVAGGLAEAKGARDLLAGQIANAIGTITSTKAETERALTELFNTELEKLAGRLDTQHLNHSGQLQITGEDILALELSVESLGKEKADKAYVDNRTGTSAGQLPIDDAAGACTEQTLGKLRYSKSQGQVQVFANMMNQWAGGIRSA